MAKQVGLDISPSQGIEALYFAKGDVDQFKYPFTDKEYKLFIQWFFDHKMVLRLKRKNYLKTTRRAYNHSLNVRPSIMIKKATMNDPQESNITARFPAGISPLTPTFSPVRTANNTPIDEHRFRSQVQVSKLILNSRF